MCRRQSSLPPLTQKHNGAHESHLKRLRSREIVSLHPAGNKSSLHIRFRMNISKAIRIVTAKRNVNKSVR